MFGARLNFMAKITGAVILSGCVVLSPPAEAAAPEPPTNITADGSYGRVALSWIKSLNTVYCNIYRNDEDSGWSVPKYTYVDPDERFYDYDVAVGETYSYRISAGNDSYEESDLSLPAVTVTVHEGTSIRQSTPAWDAWEPLSESGGAVHIKWLAADDALEGITHYSISRANSPSAWSTKYQYIYETEYTDTDVEPGTIYYYRLRATAPGMQSWATSARSITTSSKAGYLPGPPRNLAVTPGNRRVEFQWDASRTSGVAYSIYRTVEGKPWQETPLYTDIYRNSFIDTSVENAVIYYYRITAFNENGESSPASSPAVMPSSSGVIVDPDTGEIEYPSSDPSVGTDCFIATAAYGSAFQEKAGVLYFFRDRYLAGSRAGNVFVNLYYRVSPPLAEAVSGNELFKIIVRAHLNPVVRLIGFLTWG